MSKKTTLERAYFHINNGGLTFSIIERVDVRKDCIVFPPNWQRGGTGSEDRVAALAALPREDRYNRSWKLKVETNHFGFETSYSFPILPVTVKWLIWSLQRVLDRMEAPQTLPSDAPFGYETQENVQIDVKDGKKQNNCYWPVPKGT